MKPIRTFRLAGGMARESACKNFVIGQEARGGRVDVFGVEHGVENQGNAVGEVDVGEGGLEDVVEGLGPVFAGGDGGEVDHMPAPALAGGVEEA